MTFTVKNSIDMCNNMYHPNLKVGISFDGIKVNNLWGNEDYGHDFALCEGKDGIMIVVKGTDFNEIGDIMTNIKVIKHKVTLNSGKSIRVHLGYHDAATEIIRLLKNDLDAMLLKRNRPIHVTGHSLGGAVATLISLYLKELDYDNVDCRTFAAPACGDVDFRTVMELEFPTFERYVYITDYVPFLIFFFKHPAVSIVFDGKGNSKVYKRNTFKTILSIILMFFAGSKKRKTAIEAHYPITYLNAIKLMK